MSSNSRENELVESALELCRAKRVQEFIFWGERALESEAANVKLLNALARIYLSRGNFDQAMYKLERSLRADSYNVETLWLLATVFHMDKQPGKVRLIHQRLTEICASRGNPRGLRAVVSRVVKMLESAPSTVVDLTDQDDVPEIGSAEFFLLEEGGESKVQISPELYADIPEISPDEFTIVR